AVAEGRVSDVPAILARGERDVNAVDLMGGTDLIWAASAGNAAMVKVLLDHGADPNLRSGGLTALDHAQDHPAVVAVLRAARPPALRAADLTTPEPSQWLRRGAKSGFGVAEPVTPPTVVLGRDPEACDIVLDEEGVASRHARIDFHPGGWPI